MFRIIACTLLCSCILSSVQAQQPGRVSENSYNPAMSFILNGIYAPFTNAPEAYAIPGFPLAGEAGLPPLGLSLGESEMVISAYVDDVFYASVTTALHVEEGQTNVELEEAYVDAVGLGGGLNLRVGQFYSALGYLNDQHPHSWDFVDTALPYRAMLGRQFGDMGLQLRWLTPLPFFAEVGSEVFRAERYPGGGETGLGGWSGFLHLGDDIGFTQSWQLGLSAMSLQAQDRSSSGHAHGGAATDAILFNGDVQLLAVDLVWKWNPGGNPKQRQWKLQAEYLQRVEDGGLADSVESADYKGTQWGYYVQLAYRFQPRWRVAYRYDQLHSDNLVSDAVLLEEAGLHDEGMVPQRHSIMLEFAYSEFSQFRLQYNYDASGLLADQQVFVQYFMSLGAHGAHKY